MDIHAGGLHPMHPVRHCHRARQVFRREADGAATEAFTRPGPAISVGQDAAQSGLLAGFGIGFRFRFVVVEALFLAVPLSLSLPPSAQKPPSCPHVVDAGIAMEAACVFRA